MAVQDGSGDSNGDSGPDTGGHGNKSREVMGSALEEQGSFGGGGCLCPSLCLLF